jgi:hypothetical protein
LLLAQFAMSEDPSTAFSALQLLFDGLLMIFKDDRNCLFWLVDLLCLRSTLFIACSGCDGKTKKHVQNVAFQIFLITGTMYFIV